MGWAVTKGDEVSLNETSRDKPRWVTDALVYSELLRLLVDELVASEDEHVVEQEDLEIRRLALSPAAPFELALVHELARRIGQTKHLHPARLDPSAIGCT